MHYHKPLLTVEDLMVIFIVSRQTIYRWNRLAKEGRSRFPVSVGDTKQGLRWSREAILAYLSANNSHSPVPESAMERKKRHSTALKSLRAKGVKVASK
jgi:predicted DNA-binding transcriptional regulator AlpA